MDKPLTIGEIQNQLLAYVVSGYELVDYGQYELETDITIVIKIRKRKNDKKI